MTGTCYFPAELNQTPTLVSSLAIKQNSLGRTFSFATPTAWLFITAWCHTPVGWKEHVLYMRQWRQPISTIWGLGLGFGCCPCGTAEHRVMAQQRSVGARDTSRQDKACCLCLFPLQCFWTIAAPALVLCLKPIWLHGTTGAAEYHREQKHNEVSYTAGQTVLKKKSSTALILWVTQGSLV